MPESSQTPRRDLILALRWPVALVLMLLVVVVGALVAYWQTLDGAARGAEGIGKAADAVADRAERVAAAFFSGDVTESFISSMPERSISGIEDMKLSVTSP
ncbi:MAG: hypothetical protein AAFY88_13165, partial [Acidobacteriota bacterium]